MRTRGRSVALLVAVGMVLAGCGGSDERSSPAEAIEAGELESEATATQDSAGSTMTPPPTAADSVPLPTATPGAAPAIPVSDDPCLLPAPHDTGESVTEYSFAFAGKERVVGVGVGSDAALAEDAVVWVLLHWASGGWEDMIPNVDDWLGDFAGPPRTRVVISAQADAATPAFWSQSETFNRDYLVELFGMLEQSLCLERSKVVLVGQGQGALAAVQGICGADLPVDVAVLWLGLAKVLDCEPPNAIPLISLDFFEFEPLVGHYWDGSWNPPVPQEVAATGGIDATPEDLAFWSELYDCSGPPEETFLVDDGDLLERDTTVLAYRDCDATLVAIGLQNEPLPFEASKVFDAAVRRELEMALGS